MKKRILASIAMGALAGSLLSMAPASAGSECNNGSYSSNSGRGTCSHNGGVNKRVPSYSDPGSSSWKRTNIFAPTPSWGSPKKSTRLCSGWNC